MYPPLWPAEIEDRIRGLAFNADPQIVPATVQKCTRCVMTNQRPRIVFDSEGVCSACRYADYKHKDVDWGIREWQLASLLRKHRKASGYDVIVPCSGGKDSATVAHKLKHKWGMHPLCVTWAPFMYTDIGRQNMDRFVQAGFDVVTGTPDGLRHRRLARLAFEFLGDPFHPFVYGQLAFPVHVALKYNVKVIFGGENGEAEYGGDPAANEKTGWDWSDWERVYLKSAGIDRLLGLAQQIGALAGLDWWSNLSSLYRLPPINTLKAAGLEYHWFAYYQKWHPQANYYYAAEHTGFQPCPERSEGTYSKYASIDDKLDGLHYFMAFVKFGIGRCTSDAAHEIRDGDITREEGEALVSRYDGEFPERHIDECLDYLGMDRKQLDRVIERFRKR